MKVIRFPSHEVIWCPSNDIFRMAEGARTCYKTPFKDHEFDERLVKSCLDNGHHSVLEHSSITIKFVCDRGVSHELVRHRLASFSQESTRYCNYSKSKFGHEITVVRPIYIQEDTDEYEIWLNQCRSAEDSYFELLKKGIKPEVARSVLPTCLKTEIVVTANVREWLHILELRTARDAHPDIRFLMFGALTDLAVRQPAIFEDLYKEREPRYFEDLVTYLRKGVDEDD